MADLLEGKAWAGQLPDCSHRVESEKQSSGGDTAARAESFGDSFRREARNTHNGFLIHSSFAEEDFQDLILLTASVCCTNMFLFRCGGVLVST